MAIRSIFDPTNPDGPLVGGLDNFTGSTGHAHSKMPEDLIDGKVETDEDEETEKYCDGKLNADEAVCEIAEALDEARHTEPTKPAVNPPDGPG